MCLSSLAYYIFCVGSLMASTHAGNFKSEQSFSIHPFSRAAYPALRIVGYLTLPSYLRAKVGCTLNTLPDYRNVFGRWEEAAAPGEQPRRCRENMLTPRRKAPSRNAIMKLVPHKHDRCDCWVHFKAQLTFRGFVCVVWQKNLRLTWRSPTSSPSESGEIYGGPPV